MTKLTSQSVGSIYDDILNKQSTIIYFIGLSNIEFHGTEQRRRAGIMVRGLLAEQPVDPHRRPLPHAVSTGNINSCAGRPQSKDDNRIASTVYESGRSACPSWIQLFFQQYCICFEEWLWSTQTYSRYQLRKESTHPTSLPTTGFSPERGRWQNSHCHRLGTRLSLSIMSWKTRNKVCQRKSYWMPRIKYFGHQWIVLFRLKALPWP